MKIKKATGNPATERDYRFDNIKFILIVLVVCGHMMELFKGTSVPYKVIYSFHMPAFIFITGRFARFDAGKVFKKLIMPYMIFQPVYLIFIALLEGKTFELQYTTPYWLLWYLLAVIVYYFLIPILPDRDNIKAAVLIILCALVAGLIVGFDSTAGYYLSVSRIVVFLPFFLLGYYSISLEKSDFIAAILKQKWLIVVAALLSVTGSMAIIKLNVTKKMLYGSYCYVDGEGSLQIRLLIYVVALMWIWLLRVAVIDKKIPVITKIGQKTLWIYLLHGFVIKLFKYFMR